MKHQNISAVPKVLVTAIAGTTDCDCRIGFSGADV